MVVFLNEPGLIWSRPHRCQIHGKPLGTLQPAWTRWFEFDKNIKWQQIVIILMVMWYIWSCSLKYSKIKLRFWEICSTELVIISKSLIACRWMLDFIDLLHFYRSQPLMGRRHLRVNQQGRLVVESFCRRCRFECHGAQWCGPAGLSRISRLQAWCCAFRRSSVAGGGICAW